MRRAQAADLDPQGAVRAGQERGGQLHPVGVVLLDREDVSLELGAGARVERLDLGIDRLADLPLGRPIDIEAHLHGDHRGVELGDLLPQFLRLLGPLGGLRVRARSSSSSDCRFLRVVIGADPIQLLLVRAIAASSWLAAAADTLGCDLETSAAWICSSSW